MNFICLCAVVNKTTAYQNSLFSVKTGERETDSPFLLSLPAPCGLLLHVTIITKQNVNLVINAHNIFMQVSYTERYIINVDNLVFFATMLIL